MTGGTVRSPLSWLGGLLVVYLTVPLLAFFIRFSGSRQKGFNTPGLWSALRTSVESATITTAIVAVLGVPLAYMLVRHRGPIASVVGVIVQLPLALPPVMSGILLIYLIGPYTTLGRWFHGRLVGSVAGIVIAQTFVSAPFLIIAARSAFATVDPSLDDLAATLGHHPLARFLRVSLPVALPGIRAGLLLTWLRAIGEYGANVIVAYHPYSLPVYVYVQFSGAGIPDTQAPTVLVMAAAAVAVLVSQIRRPTAIRREPVLPTPQPPSPREPTRVAFDLDVHVGTFGLRLSHEPSSHRLAILGPSGSGKSMTLKTLAGLLPTSSSSVEVDGERLDGVPPERRHIAYVPQGLVLFPHRTVWQQLLFATDADAGRAAWWLETLGLSDLAGRYPDQLSGGQRQRVSLAQALCRDPRLVLLDEPFSALDAPVRDDLRRQLRRLQREAGLSTVLVTHDPEEAALLADEVMVISSGRLLQAGNTKDVYTRPASPEVARLLGIENLSEATVAGPDLIDVGGQQVPAPTGELRVGTAAMWCIRPEHISLHGAGTFALTVDDVADLGSSTVVSFRLSGGGPELRARTSDWVESPAGEEWRADLPAERITVWAAPDPAPIDITT